MKNLKQCLCRHSFELDSVDYKAFVSIGDEMNNLTSTIHRFICSKCGEKMAVVDKWHEGTLNIVTGE